MENIKEIVFSLLQEGIFQQKNSEFNLLSTCSMQPMFDKKDILIVKKEKIRKGDVIVCKSKKVIYAHRCVREIKKNNKIYYILKGDNLYYLDLKIEEKEILGKIVKIKRGNKIINLNSRFWRVIGYFISFISLIQSKLMVDRTENKNSRIIGRYNSLVLSTYRFFLGLIINLSNRLYSLFN
jgi:signal peptidase I